MSVLSLSAPGVTQDRPAIVLDGIKETRDVE